MHNTSQPFLVRDRPFAVAQRIFWPENDAICQSPALGEISRMAVFMELHGYHGMVRSRFSRDPAPPAGCSAVRFRPWGALTVSQVPQHVPLTPDHSATICGHVGSAAGDLACGFEPPSAHPPLSHPPMPAAARLAVRFALPSPQRTPAPSLSFSRRARI